MEVAKLSSDVRNEEIARLLEENQNLHQMVEERNAQLAIIQSVQEGLASRLDVQSIYDLVGDKIREIFDAQGTAVYIFNHGTETLETPYCYLKKRFEIEARPFSDHPIAKLMVDTAHPIRYSTVEEYRTLGGAILENSEEYKSGMYVPLMVEKEIKGMLGVANLDKENAYGESDLRLLTTLANSMSVALENARLFAETEQHAAELQIINSVQEGLATKLDIRAIYELVGDKIREIFHNADTEIRIHDPRTNLIRFPYFTDKGKRMAMEPIPLTDVGASSYILRTGKTLVINENLMQEMEKYGWKMLPGGHPAKSAVFVPLTVNNQARGLIVLGDVEHEHAFSEADVRLLQTLANSMSTALENARLFNETARLLKETEERNAELALINSVQSALVAKLNIQGIYDAVGDRLREIFNQSDVGIAIYDDKNNLIHIPYTYEGGKRVMVDPFALDEQGFLAHVLRTRETLVINENMAQEMEKYGSHVIARTLMDKSLVYVPLLVGDQARGVLSIKDSQHEHAFNDTDVRLLTTIANSMSVALENARLFGETQHLLKETEQRNAELAIINSVQAGLASKLDMQAIYDLVGDKIRDLFSAQSVWIVIVDQDTRTRQFKYSYEKGQRFYPSGVHPYNKLTEHLIATKKTLVINQEADARIAEFQMTSVANTERFKSAIFVPLITDNELKGFISLQNIERENAFPESDINLLSTLAASMSVALENARLFDETQRLLRETEQRAAELAIINMVQEGLAAGMTSNEGMQAIYDLVADKIRELFHAQSGWILTFDLTTRTRHVECGFYKGQRFHYPDPLPFNKLTEHLIATKKALVINRDAEARSAEFEMVLFPGVEQFKSAVFVPLITGNEMKGWITVQSEEKENAFSEADVNLLSTFASSISVAIENTRLFDEVQRKNAEITESLERETASNDILRVIAASPTNIQPVLDVIAQNAAQLSGSDDAIITLRDDDILRVDSHYGAIPTFSVGEGMRFNRDSVAGRAIIESRPVQAIHNQHGVKPEYPEGDKIARKYGYRMTCAVPLLREGKAIGAISIRRIKPELLTEKQIALIQSFANQAAIAVENVRLFNETTRLLKETEQRAAELAIINNVQQALSSKLEMEAIYELVGDQMQEIFDAQSLLIVTFDHSHELAQVTYNCEKGIRHYSEPYPFTGLNRYLIQSGRTLLINENIREWQSKLDMIVLPGTEIPRSMVFVPLNSGKGVSGFISLQNLERERAFSEMDVRLLETLASAMSVALENASLFDETQQLFLEAKDARMAAEQANQAKSTFLSSMSHELRTPLNAIINFVEMVARGMIGPVNQEQVELLDQALHSSKHLLNLINDVLDISKIQAGQLTLFVEEQVSVQVEVEAALSIAGGLLQERGLQLIRDVDAHLPLISCDRRRVRQVLLNLIGNAIKFTQTGTVTVSVKNQGQELLFAVIDTGPGIPADKQSLIFEPFLQAEHGERQVHGTGLGLPISRSLVRAHGGELWVNSQPGEGSAFFFSLPIERRSAS